MKTISAFQCEHCRKVYANGDTAKSHERRCYFNPATHSCVCCSFLDVMSVEITKWHYHLFKVCLKNEDISNRKLRTQCSLFYQSEFDGVFGFATEIPPYEFDRDLSLERLADKIEWFKQ